MSAHDVSPAPDLSGQSEPKSGEVPARQGPTHESGFLYLGDGAWVLPDEVVALIQGTPRANEAVGGREVTSVAYVYLRSGDMLRLRALDSQPSAALDTALGRLAPTEETRRG